jgi:hypothetical protein
MAEECNSCHAEIDWAQHTDPTRKAQPVDHDSAGKEGGRLALWRDPQTGVLMFRYLSKKNPLRPGEKLGTSHWGTCTHSTEWRGHPRSDPDSPGRPGATSDGVIICARPGAVITDEDRAAVNEFAGFLRGQGGREVQAELTGRLPVTSQALGIAQLMPWPPGSNGEAANR